MGEGEEAVLSSGEEGEAQPAAAAVLAGWGQSAL